MFTQDGDFSDVSTKSCYVSLQVMELNSPSRDCGLNFVTRV